MGKRGSKKNKSKTNPESTQGQKKGSKKDNRGRPSNAKKKELELEDKQMGNTLRSMLDRSDNNDRTLRSMLDRSDNNACNSSVERQTVGCQSVECQTVKYETVGCQTVECQTVEYQTVGCQTEENRMSPNEKQMEDTLPLPSHFPLPLQSRISSVEFECDDERIHLERRRDRGDEDTDSNFYCSTIQKKIVDYLKEKMKFHAPCIHI